MSPTRKEASPRVPFEEAIGKLESIVGQLEEGDLPLEKSLELFEEGIRMSKACAQQLHAAEKRIELLLEDEKSGEDRTEPFEPSEEE